jgi:hypothetical protein
VFKYLTSLENFMKPHDTDSQPAREGCIIYKLQQGIKVGSGDRMKMNEAMMPSEAGIGKE